MNSPKNAVHEMIFRIEGDNNGLLPGWYMGNAIFKDNIPSKTPINQKIDFKDFIESNEKTDIVLISVNQKPIRHGKGLFKFDVGDEYNGDWQNNIRCGQGEHKFKNGSIYEGGWHQDNFQGKGKFTHPDGSIYIGPFKCGMSCGKDGEFIKKENKQIIYTYIGNWKDNKKNGQGLITYSNGIIYDGYWINDKRYGEGTLNDNHNIYEGFFEDDKFITGIIKYSNGNHFEGNCENEKPFDGVLTYNNHNDFKIFTGKFNDGVIESGTMNFHNNSKYIGPFVDNKFHGEGVMMYFDGNVYIGLFENNNKHGIGTMHSFDKETKHGTWKDDSFYEGTIVYPNGDYLEIKWVNGLKIETLKRKITYLTGDIYEGEILNDKRNGYGIMKYKNGGVYDGNWLDDKKSGQGTLNIPGVVTCKGMWLDDELATVESRKRKKDEQDDPEEINSIESSGLEQLAEIASR